VKSGDAPESHLSGAATLSTPIQHQHAAKLDGCYDCDKNPVPVRDHSGEDQHRNERPYSDFETVLQRPLASTHHGDSPMVLTDYRSANGVGTIASTRLSRSPTGGRKQFFNTIETLGPRPVNALGMNNLELHRSLARSVVYSTRA